MTARHSDNGLATPKWGLCSLNCIGRQEGMLFIYFDYRLQRCWFIPDVWIRRRDELRDELRH